jgi:hypothetical protein
LPKRPSAFAPEVIGFGQRHRDPACSQARISFEGAAIGDDIEPLRVKRRLRCLRHGGKLRAIRTDIGHLVRDDQMVRALNRHLHL